MTDSLFEDPNEEVTFDSLVGEGKKYRDPDTVAKAVLEKDRFIEQLKTEAEAMRNELRSRTNLDEIVERLTKTPEPREITPVRQEPTPNNPENEPRPDLTEEVRKLLLQEKDKETKEHNLQTVRSGLKERFGADYNQTLKTIANDLSVSEKFLLDMATTSPTGFFKLVDSVQPADNRGPLTPPRSNDRPAPSGTGRKNKAYFDEIRKRSVNEYFSPRVQNELYREAMAQGDKFYQ